MHSCKICNYESYRLDNYNRHLRTPKHSKMTALQTRRSTELQLEEQNQKYALQQQTLPQSEDKDFEFICTKCKIGYANKRNFISHTAKCVGVDVLTCPRCMKTFDNSGNKCRHIKSNNCKPVSIFHYNQRIGRIANSDAFINNYGSERLEHMKTIDIIKLLRRANSETIFETYLIETHFKSDFPENHNIKFTKQKFYIKIDNKWTQFRSFEIARRLYSDIGSTLYHFVTTNKELIQNTGTGAATYDEILDACNWTQLEIKKQDKRIKNHLISIVRETETIHTNDT
jgi:hypothetical protein